MVSHLQLWCQHGRRKVYQRNSACDVYTFEEAEALKVGGGEEDQQALTRNRRYSDFGQWTLVSEFNARLSSSVPPAETVYRPIYLPVVPHKRLAFKSDTKQTGDAEVVDSNIEVDERQFNPNFLTILHHNLLLPLALRLSWRGWKHQFVSQTAYSRQEAMRKKSTSRQVYCSESFACFVHFITWAMSPMLPQPTSVRFSESKRCDRVEASKKKAALRES